jgi:hypothetical protein
VHVLLGNGEPLREGLKFLMEHFDFAPQPRRLGVHLIKIRPSLGQRAKRLGVLVFDFAQFAFASGKLRLGICKPAIEVRDFAFGFAPERRQFHLSLRQGAGRLGGLSLGSRRGQPGLGDIRFELLAVCLKALDFGLDVGGVGRQPLAFIDGLFKESLLPSDFHPRLPQFVLDGSANMPLRITPWLY